jgi:hypothetical protein
VDFHNGSDELLTSVLEGKWWVESFLCEYVIKELAILLPAEVTMQE